MPGNLEGRILYDVPVIVLDHAAVSIAARADHNIAGPDIVSRRDAAPDTDHQDDPQVGETRTMSFKAAVAMTSLFRQCGKTAMTTLQSPMRLKV